MSARTPDLAALRSESLARVVGNLAGVVEWANEAFGRLTGIPLDETLDKPVTLFLERAGIELEVVDFVAQHFFEGRVCRIEFPFERPDGSRLDVLLEVEALRDEHGEIDRFLAIAREQVRGGGEPTASLTAELTAAPISTPRSQPRCSGQLPLDLSAEVERELVDAAGRARNGVNPPAFDLELAPSLDPIEGTRLDLVALVRCLLASATKALSDAGDAFGALSVTTGQTTPNRRFVSKVHAIPVGPAAFANERRVYLEVHDTARPLAPAAIERIRRGEPGGGPGGEAREAELVRASEWAQRLGATLAIDSTPGCGNQVLVLFPAPTRSLSDQGP